MKVPTIGIEGLQHRAIEQLMAAVQQISLARDLDAVMKIVRRAARELTGADGATFVLREGELCYYAEEDVIRPLWRGKRFPLSSCISGWTMIHRQPAVIEDIYADPRIPADAYRPTFVKSLAMVPIRPSSPIGAIGNYWASRHLATSEEVKLLQALADSTSVALENIQLYSELKRQVSEAEEAKRELAHQLDDVSRLHRVSARISKTMVLEAIVQEVVEAFAGIMNTDKGMLLLYNEEKESLCNVASIGFNDEFLKRVKMVPSGVAGCGTAFAERRTVIVEDVETDPIFAPLRDAAKIGGFRATYSVPLISSNGQIIGIIATHFAQPYRPPEHKIHLVETLASQASQAIENARLYHKAQEEIVIRKKAQEELLEETRTVELIQRIGMSLTAQLDLQKLVQAVTDTATELIGAQFGAFFYNVVNKEGETYMLYTLSGAPREGLLSISPAAQYASFRTDL